MAALDIAIDESDNDFINCHYTYVRMSYTATTANPGEEQHVECAFALTEAAWENSAFNIL